MPRKGTPITNNLNVNEAENEKKLVENDFFSTKNGVEDKEREQVEKKKN